VDEPVSPHFRHLLAKAILATGSLRLIAEFRN
jgi:hypothetical protein